MEDIVEIPQSLLWGLCDQATFTGAFQAAIDFELLVLEWAFSQGYSREIRQNKQGNRLKYPSFTEALFYLKNKGHVSESLSTQIKTAWDTRNDLMHNFAWKSLLLGPEQSKDCLLHEAYETLQAARFAVHAAWGRSPL
jgi:hypothetical protein